MARERVARIPNALHKHMGVSRSWEVRGAVDPCVAVRPLRGRRAGVVTTKTSRCAAFGCGESAGTRCSRRRPDSTVTPIGTV
jgi:hypothetical protein